MPGLGDPELARRMPLVQPEVKILYMSRHTDRFLDARSMEGTLMVRTPFESSLLSQTIREVLLD